jgi:transposase
MEHLCFVGIDVSKAHLDVYVRPSGESFRVSHDDAGFAALIARVRPLTPTVVVLEATGGYEITVAVALAGARLPVAVINPRQIRDFARATGQLAKTDALDARVIALFAEAVRPIARPLPDEQARALGNWSPVAANWSTCSAPSRTAAVYCVIAAFSAISRRISLGWTTPSAVSRPTSRP